ncbi:MAG TPA: hypothetical protein VF857_00455, partial [Spirochaetota bacterium]
MIRYLSWLCAGVLLAAILAGVFIYAQELDGKRYTTPSIVQEPDDGETLYRPGDWEQYVPQPEYNLDGIEKPAEPTETFEAQGSVILGMRYGKSVFLKSKYKRFQGDLPHSEVIKSGFNPENDIRLLMQGHSGKRLTVFVDHDSTRENSDENRYVVQYHAVQDDEVLRELNAGDVDLHVANSKYVIFDSRAEKAYGVDLTMRKDDFTFKGFGSISKGNDEVETFVGRSAGGSISIAEYQFVRDTYFQIEPYRRYDGITDVSAISFPASYSLVTFTSSPANPLAYQPRVVNIDPNSVELWYDDQTGIKKSGTFQNPPDKGFYIKLSEGTDFTVNYSTGEISLIKSITEKGRLFALYRLAGGALSSDPAVRDDIVDGKHFVFIKYGTSIEEDFSHSGGSSGDKNGDGRINHDIYEIRSRYFIGERKILPENFVLLLYLNNRLATASDTNHLGKYVVDYQKGIVSYNLREPFRTLFDTVTANRLYGAFSSDLYTLSRYTQHLEYVHESTTYQLKHMNVIEGSVSVKVNGATLSPSLYSVNYVTGMIEFVDPNNPVIGSTTPVEVHYQYSERGEPTKAFVGGFRGDYRVNDSISFGGTVLYSRSGLADKIPTAGTEAESRMVYEGDASVYLGPSKWGSLASAITSEKIKDIPLEVKGYAEYARSYRNTNVFGKAIIDDIETSGDALTLSLSEKDWLLSSLPSPEVQANRALLHYLYYRNPSDPERLYGEGYAFHPVPYAVKPGPYNIEGGHISFANSDKNRNQTSLVFDFDFSTGNIASTAVRLGSGEVDLSGLQYIEVWYRSTGGSGNVMMNFDVGALNEDSDGSGVLKTEDVNHNGYLDFDPSRGIDEDVGFAFNPAGGVATRIGSGPGLSNVTKGDGVLTSEDFNNNGILDTTEQIISFPGDKADIENAAPAEKNIPITVQLGDTTWKSARIYLQRSSSSFTDADRYTLAHAVSLRLNIRNSSATSGKIWIDSIRLVSSRWNDIRIGGVPKENPDQFKVSVVDTWNDAEYNAHSFIREKGSLFESLYGDRSREEMNDDRESALSLQYQNLSGTRVSVSRIFQKPLNLKYYKTANIWYNPRELMPGDTLYVYVGSSENDYFLYTIPITFGGYWQEATLQLKSGSHGSFPPSSTAGYPDLSHVRFLRCEVLSSGSGRIWIDNIMASESEKVKDDAYWVEWSARAKRPLYVTAGGTPIVENLLLSYVQRMQGAEFSSPGRTDNGLYARVREARSECTIIPRLTSAVAYSRTDTQADSFDDRFTTDQRGKSGIDNTLIQFDYLSETDFIPSWGVYYSGIQSENSRNENGVLVLSNVRKEVKKHSPRISLDERFTDPFQGKWKFRFVSDNSFEKENITRTDITSIMDGEERQKTDFKMESEYCLGHFSFAPEGELYSHEVIKFFGRSAQSTEILTDVNGNYHFPFFSDEGFKYAEHNIRGGWKINLAGLDWINPSSTVNYRYAQNGFQDYTAADVLKHPVFARSHAAQ